ncbi:rare lipoprotein A [Mizugakiibacter sediminis]|uniref:Endolytic peptidoglycan transglycosylase RlpA n=1 Tax=Mizugakiibacter sediminis TaxID=1475481 RepID=A0A0K8QMS0_9GAMM|nr:septal ring lytic transglycosylase RlpA family protein [Mizugakiibacter sediminis]GAP66195.1 rare lipoprotein A [Mizugakiibacter sediminis]
MRRALGGLVCAALLLAGCAHERPRPQATGAPAAPGGGVDDTTLPQSSRYRLDRDGGPGAPPIDVSRLPEPLPKIEPRSRYGNKSPYTVLGHTYTVLPNAKGYVERGIASWYGNKFHGYMTSNFEPYDMYAFTAAHKTLPLPSYARVTNLENGKSVIVRINDRGPFAENRLIDLSYAAAVRIGIWPKGTGLVEVRAIDPAAPELPPPPTVTAAGGAPRLYLQAGAFADPANAARLAARLRALGVGAVGVSEATVDGRRVTRVRIGPLPDVDAADRISARLEREGIPHVQASVDD